MADDVRKVYGDIIDLERPEPRTRKRMSAESRAAQFSPFEALTGFEDMVDESARETETFAEKSEEQIRRISDAIGAVIARLAEKPVVKITYFQPDSLKSGGRYVTVRGRVTKADTYTGCLILDGKVPVFFEQISELENDMSPEGE